MAEKQEEPAVRLVPKPKGPNPPTENPAQALAEKLIELRQAQAAPPQDEEIPVLNETIPGGKFWVPKKGDVPGYWINCNNERIDEKGNRINEEGQKLDHMGRVVE